MVCSSECGCKAKITMLVFIPGIMGSRLKNEESSDIVWDPAPGKGWYDSSQMASVKARREKELTQLQSVDDGGVFNLLKHAYNIASDAVDYAVVYVAEIPRKSWRNVSGVVSSMFHYTFLSAKERKAELANDDKEDAFYRKKNFCRWMKARISIFARRPQCLNLKLKKNEHVVGALCCGAVMVNI